MRLIRSIGCNCALGLVFVLAVSDSGFAAQTPLDPTRLRGAVVDEKVIYLIGGGKAVSMSHAPTMLSVGVGVGWNANLICGDMSLRTTVSNQLNGITEGFEAIMGEMIQAATAAVAALPALIIQRADPGLYNLLTNGILQARLDFDRSKVTCRAIAERMADWAGGQLGWDRLAEGMVLTDAVQSNDAVSAIDEAETSHGNGGVPWVGGENAGGADQPPVRIVGDVVRAGYNLLNGRGATSDAPVADDDCNNRLTCATWESPAAAVAWAVRVMGEREIRTCADCVKMQTTAGVGLSTMIQEEYDDKVDTLQKLVTRALPTSIENLDAAGSASVAITRSVIEALRDEPDQDVLAKRLASEVALSSVLEKALVLQRLLLSGRKEPNVAANQLAQDAVSHEGELLEQEIRNLKEEFELRHELAANSPLAIIQRHAGRSEVSRGVGQGDRGRDRLNRIERPSNRPN